ncbi:ATP synthase subunit B family protein [Candidatus Deianiraea vastatrix]|uniref:Uncharacterized protein n=1 Tax=Candidatus Deianiraea vastatrix TaxID=2163644 RepID=A0A5B8XCS3_9RICK|nr:ATP synthase F0 subunit B [Candidatus Deianiraea vastatrix]QED23179.1 hypothetical protein Deia_00375 [Candidatus Deianiraea vastatrix]
MLRIPIIAYIFLYFTAWFIDLFITSKSIAKISRFCLIGISCVYSIAHLLIISNEKYFIDIQTPFALQTGFLLTSNSTMPLSILAIIMGCYVMFREMQSARTFKFAILQLCALYSVNFTSSNFGIEMCVTLYFISHVSIFINKIKNQKNVNRSLICAMLSYFCISYGMSYSSSLILLGLLIYSGMMPFSLRYLSLDEEETMNVSTLNSIDAFFMLSVIVAFINCSNLNQKILNYGVTVPLLGFFIMCYGFYNAISDSVRVKSSFHISTLLIGLLVAILGVVPNEYNLQDIVWYIMPMFFASFALSVNRVMIGFGTPRYTSDRNNEIILLSILSGAPIISHQCAKYHITVIMKYFGILTIFGQVFFSILLLKSINSFKNMIKNTDQRHVLNEKITIYTSLILLIASGIKDLSLSYYAFVINTISFFIILILCYLLFPKITLKERKDKIAKFISRFINSIIAIYDMTIMYISSLVKNIKHLMEDDVSLFKLVIRDLNSENISVKRQSSVIMIFIILGFALMIKIFS